MARGAQNHTHKYFQNAKGIWFCGLPKCSHYRPSGMPQPIGWDSICWTCNQPMELTEEDMEFEHPTHAGCDPYIPAHQKKISRDMVKKIAESLEQKDEIEVIEPEDK